MKENGQKWIRTQGTTYKLLYSLDVLRIVFIVHLPGDLWFSESVQVLNGVSISLPSHSYEEKTMNLIIQRISTMIMICVVELRSCTEHKASSSGGRYSIHSPNRCITASLNEKNNLIS